MTEAEEAAAELMTEAEETVTTAMTEAEAVEELMTEAEEVLAAAMTEAEEAAEEFMTEAEEAIVSAMTEAEEAAAEVMTEAEEAAAEAMTEAEAAEEVDFSAVTTVSDGDFSAVTTVSDGKLIVGTEAGFAPYEYLVGDEVKGIDMDIAQAIADALGVELEVQNMDFDGALLAVQQGKVDIVAAGVSVSEEREEVMDFSVKYVDSKDVILVNKADLRGCTGRQGCRCSAGQHRRPVGQRERFSEVCTALHQVCPGSTGSSERQDRLHRYG